jgi:hypothetical protein
MEITVNIKTCKDCRHRDHSGAFTEGGAKPICGHSGSIMSGKKAKLEGIKNPYHWKYRVLDSDLNIPNWCPLKKGCKY